MTDTEFLSRLPEGARKVSAEELELIQFVYNYHPSIHPIEGKDQIVMLYSTFGMRIIRDMYGTAKYAHELEDERRQLRTQLNAVERKLEELSMA